jgi:(p)ppGpp synthase/HD superfamily hydrolase
MLGARAGRADEIAISPQAAEQIAARLLGDLRTTLGGTQIAHARRVAARARYTGDHRIIAAALLHDVLEKTDTTAAGLRELTGDPEVVALVETLTHDPDESYEVYLARCAADRDAFVIKRLDLMDKLVTDEVHVSMSELTRIRHTAAVRLARLNRFADRASAIR